eukprot:tig00000525_g1949.t1
MNVFQAAATPIPAFFGASSSSAWSHPLLMKAEEEKKGPKISIPNVKLPSVNLPTPKVKVEESALYVDDPTIFNNRINDKKVLDSELEKQKSGIAKAPKVTMAPKKTSPVVSVMSPAAIRRSSAVQVSTDRRFPGKNMQSFLDMARSMTRRG